MSLSAGLHYASAAPSRPSQSSPSLSSSSSYLAQDSGEIPIRNGINHSDHRGWKKERRFGGLFERRNDAAAVSLVRAKDSRNARREGKSHMMCGNDTREKRDY